MQSRFHGFLLRGVELTPRVLEDVALMLVAGYILVGAVCERIQFRAFIACELFLGGLLYPAFAGVAWRGGWLAARGFVDYGGSSVVHSVGGFSAMALALLLGPRIGKYSRDGQPRPFLAHNIVFVVAGTFLVLAGWIGLSGGTLLAILNANLAAVGGAAAAMAFWTVSYGKPDISMACNGLLAGMVAISASAPFVGPTSAVVIGAIAGLIACGGVLFNERTLKIDDPCGSISVHGYCGWWGAVALGLFANSPSGVAGLFHGNAMQLVWQFAGATTGALFAFGATYAVFAVVNAFWRMRVDHEVEIEGLDLNEFGMLAYPDDEGV